MNGHDLPVSEPFRQLQERVHHGVGWHGAVVKHKIVVREPRLLEDSPSVCWRVETNHHVDAKSPENLSVYACSVGCVTKRYI